ncbi:MAG: hypothetical protein GF393_10660 [Armatimonadia bacterium]|nr:hypothetical protein [Armatimonadia bacterium]
MTRAITVMLIGVVSASMAIAQPQFENLGTPVLLPGLSVRACTEGPDGEWTAWGPHEAPDGHAIIGVDVATGESRRIGVNHYGRSHIQFSKGPDGQMYIYCGVPSHFFRYDAEADRLVDLGVPADPGHYFLGSTTSLDDVFYVGTYPNAELSWCDMKTGEIGSSGRIPEDDRQSYIIHPAVADSGVVYCPVGLHHMELWSWNPDTGEKHQILTPELTKHHGSPKVWLGTDGNVYGEVVDTVFRCEPDGIVLGETCERRSEAYRFKTTDQYYVGSIDARDRLHLTDRETGEKIKRDTDYEGEPVKIYAVGPEHDGKVWGGTIKPSRAFTYDPATGEMVDLGHFVRGGTQIYDIEVTPEGLLMASYGGASIDLYHPGEPLEEDANPERFRRVPAQERPNHITEGPDGRYYVGTVPVKGRLGGALMRIDVAERSIDHWAHIVEEQSIISCAPVPETNEVFCTSSIRGGTSAEPTQDEAVCLLWDIEAEEVAATFSPVPGTTEYLGATRADNGLIYGLTNTGSYYAFDPVARETVHVGTLPGERLRFPYLHDEPVGEDGLIIGLVDDLAYAIDPADHSIRRLAQHDALRAHGFYVTADGVLYCGRGSDLWRVDLLGE